MATIVYLIRHGRTALNATGALRGRIDVPLDDAGRAEAQRLGILFAPVTIAQVISSPLARAVDTARDIAVRHGVAVSVDPGFIDRDYGPWAGRPASEAAARYGSLDRAPDDEIESRERLERRVAAALDRVLAHATDRRVLVVAHEAVNRALIRRHCAEWREAGDDIPQPTGCWNRLVFAGGDGCACEVVGAVPGDGRMP